MRVLSRLFVLCLCFGSWPVIAQSVADLYQVREPVQSQQPQDRDEALRRAFDVLVVRLSGDLTAPSNPALAALRVDPRQLVGKYSYDGGEAQTLLVDFDPTTTSRALRQAGVPLWGAKRPTVLTWWLNDATDGSRLIGDGQSMAGLLRQAAQHRGLPLQLPLADLQEQMLATERLLDSAQLDELKNSSQRYGADALLAVHAREEDAGWTADWQLHLGTSQEQGTVVGKGPEALADAVLLATANALAPHFLVQEGQTQALTLIIEGADLSRYAQLQQLLAGFDARLVNVEGARLSYQVNAGVEQLRAQLALLQLQEITADASGADMAAESSVPATAGSILRFGWR